MKTGSLLKNRKLYIIFSITLISVMGVASITPAFPKISETFNLTKPEIGLMITAFTFPGIILTLFTGVLADIKGRKSILIPSLFLFGISGFAITLTKDFTLIILLRFLQGVGAASLGSLNTTLIGDFFKGKNRPVAMGYNASVLSFSTAFYPLIGGALAGLAWYYPFYLPLVAIPVGLFVLLGLEEPEFEKVGNFRNYIKAVVKNITRKEVIAVFILSVLTFIILYGGMLTYLPFLLKEKFGFTAPKIGMVLSLSSITTALLAGWNGKLTLKFGSLNLLRTAFFLYLVVMLMFSFIDTFYIILIPVLLFGVAQALNIPGLQTVLVNLAPDSQRGAFMSTNGMVLRLGQTLGPMVIGIGFSFGGLEEAYYLAGFIALLGLLVLFTMLNVENISRKSKE